MDALNQLLLSLWPVQHATLCNCSKRKINQSSLHKSSEHPSLKLRHSIKQSSVRWSVGVVTVLFRLLAWHFIFKFEVRHSRVWLQSYFHSYILPSFTLLFSRKKWAAPYRAGKLERRTVDFLFLPRSQARLPRMLCRIWLMCIESAVDWILFDREINLIWLEQHPGVADEIHCGVKLCAIEQVRGVWWINRSIHRSIDCLIRWVCFCFFYPEAFLLVLLFASNPLVFSLEVMTISYQFNVATASFAGFPRLLVRWKGR